MIRAAVAGLGWWGKHIVRRMKDSDALRVVTSIEANPAHAGFAAEHGIAFTTDFAAVLRDPDIDAVILCTPGLLIKPGSALRPPACLIHFVNGAGEISMLGHKDRAQPEL